MVLPTAIPPEVKPPVVATANASPRETSGNAARYKIDINTASLETLAAVPAVGLKTARQIIAARPFTRLDELNQLDGLSTERLAHLQLVLTIGVESGSDPTAKPAESTGPRP